MKTVRLKSWVEFEETISSLKAELNYLKSRKEVRYVSDLLFRGQSNHAWRLHSTLDRSLNFSEINLTIYHEIISEAYVRIREVLESFRNLQMDIKIRSFQDFIKGEGSVEWIAYMAYLRHHGFPSPLLDWTTSLEVAAYFAFWEKPKTEFVSIYTFVEYLGGGKGGWVTEPHIHSIGPSLVVHPRHERQCSQYTMCMKQLGDQGYCYTSHENAFSLQNENQDILTKYEIPSSERQKVLSQLAIKNINTCYLFGQSDDSFIQDLSFELIDSKI